MFRKSPVEIRTSPHLKRAVSVEQIMRNVVYALLPVCAWSVYQFGISVLALIIVSTLTCLATERFFNWMSDKPSSLPDFSAVITGILLALTLPPGFPLWMAAVGGFVAIGLGKSLFGGIGYNVMNPALIGRAFVQAAFPVAITTWTPAFAPNRFVEFIPSTLAWPFMSPADTSDWVKQQGVDAFTGATPLALQKFEGVQTQTLDLLTGTVAGSAGETSALIILLCGLYLAVRRFMDWRIPATILASTVLITLPLYLYAPQAFPTPQFVLLSGGLMLGAMFMASDMVGSPLTLKGVWIYGFLIALLTVMIRYFGGLTEGVMYAILIGNAAVPLIEQYTQPRVYGTARRSPRKSRESQS
jgi:electron transport complex protein RnfD